MTLLCWIFVKYGLILYFYKVFSGCQGLVKVDDIAKLYILFLKFYLCYRCMFIHKDFKSVSFRCNLFYIFVNTKYFAFLWFHNAETKLIVWWHSHICYSNFWGGSEEDNLINKSSNAYKYDKCEYRSATKVSLMKHMDTKHALNSVKKSYYRAGSSSEMSNVWWQRQHI